MTLWFVPKSEDVYILVVIPFLRYINYDGENIFKYAKLSKAKTPQPGARRTGVHCTSI